jgi:hypothetical protein
MEWVVRPGILKKFHLNEKIYGTVIGDDGTLDFIG